jgi:hypothetical protein
MNFLHEGIAHTVVSPYLGIDIAVAKLLKTLGQKGADASAMLRQAPARGLTSVLRPKPSNYRYRSYRNSGLCISTKLAELNFS